MHGPIKAVGHCSSTVSREKLKPYWSKPLSIDKREINLYMDLLEIQALHIEGNQEKV